MDTAKNIEKAKPTRPAVFNLVPQTAEQAQHLARLMASSDLVPKDFRDRPANVLLAVQLGLELGLNPMQAVQNIAVINGRPVVWGDALLGIVQKSGLLQNINEEITGEGDDMEARCVVKRKGSKSITRIFSVADAKKAGLWEKRGANGPTPWVTFPKRMLQMRARGFALRDGFADVIKGLHLREELDDAEVFDITPLDHEPAAGPDRQSLLTEIQAALSSAFPGIDPA